MRNISISNELKSRCLGLRLGCIEAEVNVDESSIGLLAEMTTRIQQIVIDRINQ